MEETNTIDAVISQLEQLSLRELSRKEVQVRPWKHNITITTAPIYHDLLQRLEIRELMKVQEGFFSYVTFQEKVNGEKTWTIDLPQSETPIFYKQYLKSYKTLP